MNENEELILKCALTAIDALKACISEGYTNTHEYTLYKGILLTCLQYWENISLEEGF